MKRKLPCARPVTRVTSSGLLCLAVLHLVAASASGAVGDASSTGNSRRAALVPTSSGPSTHWYGGFGMGLTNNSDFVRANNDGSLSNIAADKNSVSWRVFGGYRLAEYVAIEAGYLDLGKSSFTAQSSGGISWSPGQVGTDLEADGWFLEGLVPIPIAPRWTLYARLGVYHWRTKETFFEQNFGTSIDRNSGTDALYGVAIEYDVGVDAKWVWRGELGQTRVDDDHDTTTTAGMTLVRKF